MQCFSGGFPWICSLIKILQVSEIWKQNKYLFEGIFHFEVYEEYLKKIFLLNFQLNFDHL